MRLLNVAIILGVLLPMIAGINESEPQPDVNSANIHDHPWWPPLYAAPPGGDVLTVQVNAGPGTWQIRRIAKAMDAQVEGVAVRTSGDCSEVDLCVRVVVDLFDEQQQHALAQAPLLWNGLVTYPSHHERVIYLNLTTERWHRPLTAAHELGHVFGLGHHQSRGATSIAGREMRSLHQSEIDLLNRHYGVTS